MPLSSKSFLIAHRGASRDAPENTLAAFRLAWDQGADAVECDIRLSSDGRIVVMHDQSTARTTGVDLAVADHSLVDLRELDAGRWKSPRFEGERIPLLDEVLAETPHGGELFIEIKCGAEVLPMLEGMLPSGADRYCRFIGFDADVMAETKRRLPAHRVYWLCEFPWRLPLNGANAAAIADHARRLGLDGVDVRNRGLSEDRVRQVLDTGLDIFVWTVNSAAEAKRLTSWGVRGITTDCPGVLREPSR
jgi:glycerophosphoryl diester phosphodiesterase